MKRQHNVQQQPNKWVVPAFANNTRLFWSTCLILLMSACSSTNWTTFTPTTGGYSVLMPEPRASKTGTMNTGAGALTSHIHIAWHGPVNFISAWYDFPADYVAAHGPDVILENSAALSVRNFKGEVVESKKIKQGPMEGIAYRLQSPGGTVFRFRTFMQENRVYALVTSSPEKEYENHHIIMEKFLHSFRLNKAQ